MRRLLSFLLTPLDFPLQNPHNVGEILFYCPGRLLVFVLDLDIYLLPVNDNFQRRFNPQSNLATINSKDGDFNIITDGYGFSQLPCQYQHRTLLGV